MTAHRHFRPLLLAVIVLGALFPVVAPAQKAYVEDFSTNANEDDFYSVVDWSTADGEMRLNPFAMRPVGDLDTAGSAREVVVARDHAYLADYTAGLIVIDVSDPRNPVQVGSYNSSGYATGVAIDGDYAYLADGFNGMRVLDITNPAVPTPVGSIDPSGTVHKIVIDGDLAYLASYAGGFHIVDISTPTSPSLVATFSGLSTVNDLDVEGDLLFAADYNTDLWIFDISDPQSISMVGYYSPASGNPYAVEVDGDRAYLGAYAGGLHIIDVSDPAAPLLIGTSPATGGIRGVCVRGEYVYAADFTDGVILLDIADPTAPQPIDTPNIGSQGFAVQVVGENAYVAGGGSGLQIVEACSPVPLTLLNHIQDSNSYLRPFIAGELAYVASNVDGLKILDLADPVNPQVVGSYIMPGGGMKTGDVVVRGDHAFVADFNKGLLVLDVSDPTAPALLFQTVTTAERLLAAGDRLYVTRGANGIREYDISNPAAPALVGTLALSGFCSSIVRHDDVLFVVDESNGVRIVRTTPFTIAGTISAPYVARDVAVDGDQLYVADALQGVFVYDITNPLTPVLQGQRSTTGGALGLVVDGDDLLVCESGDGIERLDVSNPSNPYLVDAYNVGVTTFGAGVFGDYAYLCNSSNGLEVVALNQRQFNEAAYFGYCLPFTTTGQPALQVRLTTSQDGRVDWQMSEYGTASWQDIPADGTWQVLDDPTDQLRWRGGLVVTDPRRNPTCTLAQVEWLIAEPVIAGVTDVPGDQGRQVRLAWAASGHDHVGSTTPIIDYTVYRRVPGTPAKAADADKAYPPGQWDYVLTMPAAAESGYSAVVPTLGDSTVTNGLFESVYFVRARTATAGVHFDAAPDSGWSVDNLAPSVPTGLKLQSTDLLAWDECLATDFRYFAVYGSEINELDGSEQLVGHTTGLSLDVTGQTPRYFLVTAVDFAGNESPAAFLLQAAAAPGSVPARTTLGTVCPNPFNPATSIRFELAAESAVEMTVFDLSGRVVRTLIDGRVMPAGSHGETWRGDDDQGRPAAAGVYLMRFRAGDVTASRKLMLVK